MSGYKNRLTVEPAKEESVAAQKGPKLKLKIKPLKAPGPAESPKDQPPVEQVPKKVKKSKKKLRDFSSLTCCDFLWDQLHRWLILKAGCKPRRLEWFGVELELGALPSCNWFLFG